jgi:hypothetical protein
MFDKAHGPEPDRRRRRSGIPLATALVAVAGAAIAGVLATTAASVAGHEAIARGIATPGRTVLAFAG